MGKIRVKTIGIEEDEKDQKKKAKQRAEAKRIEAAKKLGAAEKAKEEIVIASDLPAGKAGAKQSLEEKVENKTGEKTDKKPTKEKFAKKAKSRSKSYKERATKIDKSKKYTLKDAIALLKGFKRAKFDEAVELHINTHDKGVAGSLTLPHGSGKKTKIEIADHAKDPKKVEELVKKIEGGQIDFDILIATPESMVHLAKVARYLGPRGLMPNPKNGTVHPKPDEAAKKFEGGQINFKTEAKASIIHMTVGKVSFEEKQLSENIDAIFKAIKAQNVKNVTLKSTMSPGIKIIV